MFKTIAIASCCVFSTIFLSQNALFASCEKCVDQQAMEFDQVIACIQEQLQESHYSERYFVVRTNEGNCPLLVVNNPEGKTIKFGWLTVGNRLIITYPGTFPKEGLEEIQNLVQSLQLKGVLYSSGTYNGKTLLELFGY